MPICSPERRREIRELPPRASFVTAAAVAGLALWSNGAPTVVYPLYESAWGLNTEETTLVFAAFAVVLIPAFVLFGDLSDHVGRRQSILVGLAALAIGTLAFGIANELPLLLVGRAFMGLGVGLSLGASTAVLTELGGPARISRATATATASTATGLALATLVGGALVQYAPAPLHLSFWVLLIVTVCVAGLAMFTPRTFGAVGDSWRPQVPRIPKGSRLAFSTGALAVSTAYALGPIYLALGAQVAHELVQSSNAFVNGAVLAISAVTIGVTAILARRIRPRLAVAATFPTTSVAVLTLVGASFGHLLILFLLSSALAGIGYGLSFAGGLGLIASTTQSHNHAGALSLAYAFGYLVQAALAIALGVIATTSGLLTAIEAGSVVLIVVSAVAAVVSNLRKSATQRR